MEVNDAKKEVKDVLSHTRSMTIEITPETYIKMNEEFEREGTPIHIIVPTQEQIDNPTGVKLPETFTPQPPMIVDGSDPGPHSNN